MNIQTERLDNHTARLTVEVEPERFAQAKQKAARKIAQKVNLPGFRKGKAPYNIVLRYVGEPAIVEDAIEVISTDLYAPALTETGLKPYGPGSVEDFTYEDPMTIVFVVPLSPTVDMKDYRRVRLPYQEPVIGDRDVEAALKSLLQREAVVEPSDQPAAMGDRVTLDIHSHIHTSDDEEAEGEGFIHEHGLEVVLDASDDLLPGFSEEFVGAVAGDKRDFELTVPEDSEDYPEQRGKTAHFEVTVNDVSHITMPVLNDEFAARVTADEAEPLTLLQLRLRLRETLAQSATERVDDEYASRVLNLMVEQADIRYPEAMVADQVSSMLETMDAQLRRQGLNLEDYKKLLHKTDEDLFNDYRDAAVERVRRGLARRTLFEVEQLAPTDGQIEAEFARIAGDVDEEQAKLIREMFESQGLADAVREQFSDRQVRARLVAIGKNEAPELPAPPAAPEAAAPQIETETEINAETTENSEETA
ncbi:MAG TPA: trigger factor [Candidatus Limnocylindrales bacterium]|nr:trigger factor [Candidatus Limnocylindrales bacterium]